MPLPRRSLSPLREAALECQSLKRNNRSRNEVEITMVCSYLLQRRPDVEMTCCLRSSPASLLGAKSFHCVTGAREVVERRRGKVGRLSQALTGVLKVN